VTPPEFNLHFDVVLMGLTSGDIGAGFSARDAWNNHGAQGRENSHDRQEFDERIASSQHAGAARIDNTVHS